MKKTGGSGRKMKEMAVKGGCPNCGGDLKLVYAERDIPHFGKVLLNTVVCGCSYRHADFFAMDRHEPCRYEFRIGAPEDLDVRVVRSSSCLVKIPKLGIEISPGTDSEGYISNTEGILIRCGDILEDLLKSLKGQRKRKAEGLLSKLKKAREGKFGLTIIFEDKSGNSAILSPKAKRSALKEDGPA